MPLNPDIPPLALTYATHAADRENLESYGFTVDPDKPRWERARTAILNMHPRRWFSRNMRLSYHNLCTTIQPPAGTRYLLGLNEKYCIERG